MVAWDNRNIWSVKKTEAHLIRITQSLYFRPGGWHEVNHYKNPGLTQLRVSLTL